MSASHEIRKVRHEIVMRALQVRAISKLTPLMRRVTLGGADLAGFHSPAADDHLKLYFPLPGTETIRPALWPVGDKTPKHIEGLSKGRDYTPRRYDPQAQELDVDFVLHGAGPAASWAAQAAPGHWLVAGGPKSSRIMSDDFDHYLFIGDETALPAIGRRLEELPAQARALTLVEVADAAEQQPLASRASVERLWLHRGDAPAGQSGALLAALRQLRLPAGDTFIWGAGESRVMRLLRQQLEERGHNGEWIKTSGYWKLQDEDEN